MFLSIRKNKSLQKQHSRKDFNVSQSLEKITFKFGIFSVCARQSGKLHEKQIFTIKQLLWKNLHRQTKFWNFLSIFRSITKKPNEIRLGKGKGKIKYLSSIVKPGKTLFEVSDSSNLKVLYTSLKKLQAKTSVFVFLRKKRIRWIL